MSLNHAYRLLSEENNDHAFTKYLRLIDSSVKDKLDGPFTPFGSSITAALSEGQGSLNSADINFSHNIHVQVDHLFAHLDSSTKSLVNEYIFPSKFKATATDKAIRYLRRQGIFIPLGNNKFKRKARNARSRISTMKSLPVGEKVLSGDQSDPLIESFKRWLRGSERAAKGVEESNPNPTKFTSEMNVVSVSHQERTLEPFAFLADVADHLNMQN